MCACQAKTGKHGNEAIGGINSKVYFSTIQQRMKTPAVPNAFLGRTVL
jgi:hypothetical protein